MDILMISSGLVLQERKQNAKKRFKRIRLLRKTSGQEKEDNKENAKKEDENSKEKIVKRRGSSLRPLLEEYKVEAKARRKKSKDVFESKWKWNDCNESKCGGPSR